jgi:hypothetical protein
MTRRLLAALAAAALLTGTAVAVAATPAKITRKGVDGVRIGARHAKLQSEGLLGRLRKGCELGGPGIRDARLRAPLQGVAHLTRSSARRVRSVTVTGGAEARGVGIGDRIRDIRAAYRRVRVDHSLEDIGLPTMVRIPRKAGGRITFAVDTDTHRITAIGVPVSEICE